MSKNIIEETLVQHIKEQNSFFVFPTQTAADLWADKIIFSDNIKDNIKIIQDINFFINILYYTIFYINFNNLMA